jgi:hypothetical protein
MTPSIKRVPPLSPPKNRGENLLTEIQIKQQVSMKQRVIVPLFLKGDKRGIQKLEYYHNALSIHFGKEL